MHLPLAIFRTMGTPKIIVTIIDSTTLNEIIHNHGKTKRGKRKKIRKALLPKIYKLIGKICHNYKTIILKTPVS